MTKDLTDQKNDQFHTIMKEKLGVDKYEAWLRGVRISVDQKTACIKAPTLFRKDTIEQRFESQIKEAMKVLYPENERIKYLN